jgi:hypothetical protein
MKTRHVAALALLSIAAALIAFVSVIGLDGLAYVFIALEPTRHQPLRREISLGHGPLIAAGRHRRSTWTL